MEEREGTAGGEVVGLRYRVTRREIFAVLVALDQASRLSAAFAVVAAFAVAWNLAAGDPVQAIAWMVLLVVFPSGLFGGVWGTYSRRGWSDREVSKTFGPETIRTETHLAVETQQWTAIKSVVVLRPALVFEDVLGLIFAVPRRAMTTEQEASVLGLAAGRVVERRRPWLRPLVGALVGALAFGVVYIVSSAAR